MEAATESPIPVRLQSLDILRGLIMFVMLFVNDLAGVRGVPPWMEHIQPSDADGMTFVDIVFPAFLFVVGISIPFAIGSRLEKGVPRSQIWQHIFLRTIGLLVMGFFMVNSETIANNGPLSPVLWNLLIYVGIAMTWLTFPTSGKGSQLARGARIIGIVLLVAAALLYRGNDATGFLQMRPQWWGILGLIGWAYLGTCIVYMLCYRNIAGMVGAIGLMYCVGIAEAVGGFRGVFGLSWLAQWVSVGTIFGSQTGITVAGLVLGVMLTRDSPLKTHHSRIRWAFLYGLALLVAGVLLHTAHGLGDVFHYNKNAATPPWCLVSSAVTVWLWIVAYLIGDVRPVRLARVLVPIGQSALLAYILAPLLSTLLDLLTMVGVPPFYNMLGKTFAIGFWRSLIFAALVGWITTALSRRGIQLKL